MERLNKTRAFLTEFIIVILFFSIAAVITMGLYVEADKNNKAGVELSKAAIQAQSVAENIRSGSSGFVEGIYTEYLDEEMNISDEDKATYSQKVVVESLNDKETESGTRYCYVISICDIESGDEVYSLSVRQYKSKEVQ